MKNKVKILLAAALGLPLLSVSPVLAHTGHYHAEDTQVAATTRENTTIESRMAERKAKAEERLTQVQQNLIKARCKSTASLIANVRGRVTAFEAQRPRVYENVAKKLESLAPKLEAAGVDVTEYNQQVAELKSRVEAFDAEVAALKTAMDDLNAMDCTADPEGFVATVREAVELRESAIEKGRAIRTYMKETLRPSLAKIRTQIQAKKEDEQ